jgi:hypothetical protein
MSLINDALKRAQQAQDKQTQEAQSQAPSPAPRAPMQVAPAAPPSRLWPLALFCLVLAVILSAGGIWYLRRAQSAPSHSTAAASDASAASSASQAAAPAHTEYVVQPLPPYVPPTTEPEDSGQPPAPGVPTPSTPTQPAVDTTPNVRLEGVLYRPDKPAAIIDGRTVYVGDHVDDGNGQGVVTAITPNSVTLLWEGKSVLLRL